MFDCPKFQLNGFEIRPGKLLKINISVANVRLFVGNIPKNKSKDDILEEFQKQTGTSQVHNSKNSEAEEQFSSGSLCLWMEI